MNDKEVKSLDVLGIKPVADALDHGVKKVFEGIESFLKITCLPALEELGLMARDRIQFWRLQNILRILDKAKGKLKFDSDLGQLKIHANPRVALSIIENGSLNDNDEVQELWAGLFVSSCTLNGSNDENLIFVDLLKQLTSIEAKILRYACEKSVKIKVRNGLVFGQLGKISSDDLVTLTDIVDIHRLDRELDHLSTIGLLQATGGFHAEEEKLIADITPSALALNLYVRCQGSTKSTSEYWNDILMTEEEAESILNDF